MLISNCRITAPSVPPNSNYTKFSTALYFSYRSSTNSQKPSLIWPPRSKNLLIPLSFLKNSSSIESPLLSSSPFASINHQITLLCSIDHKQYVIKWQSRSNLMTFHKLHLHVRTTTPTTTITTTTITTTTLQIKSNWEKIQSTAQHQQKKNTSKRHSNICLTTAMVMMQQHFR